MQHLEFKEIDELIGEGDPAKGSALRIFYAKLTTLLQEKTEKAREAIAYGIEKLSGDDIASITLASIISDVLSHEIISAIDDLYCGIDGLSKNKKIDVALKANELKRFKLDYSKFAGKTPREMITAVVTVLKGFEKPCNEIIIHYKKQPSDIKAAYNIVHQLQNVHSQQLKTLVEYSVALRIAANIEPKSTTVKYLATHIL